MKTLRKKHNTKFWLIFSLMLVAICWVYPIAELGFYFLKWQNADIENYEVYLFRSELLRETNYIEPFEYLIYDEQGILRSNYPAYIFKPEYDAISILFSYAWDAINNPFNRCSVSYEAKYGYPNLISCGQWQQIQTFDFQPINNEGQ